MRWFALLLIIAYALVLTASPDPRVLTLFHLSNTSYHVLIYSLLVLETVVWYAGFFALAKLLEYSRYLKDSEEGKAFNKIAFGVGVLAFGLIIASIISSILNRIAASHLGFHKTATIINNYLTLLVPIVAFTLIGAGAWRLAGSIKQKVNLNFLRIFVLAFITLSVLFAHIVIHANNTGKNPYFLSTYPLLITVVIPYLYAWFIGVLSAYNFKVYSTKVKGLLYRRALSLLAVGMAVTTLGYIAVQFVVGTYGFRASLSFGLLLVLIYILLSIFAVGLGLVAFGAKKLKKIEEV